MARMPVNVNIGALVDKQFRYSLLAPLSSPMQRRGAIESILCPQVSPFFNEDFH
jgi:hypothetical protein